MAGDESEKAMARRWQLWTLKYIILSTDCRIDWKRKKSHWNRGIKSRVERHVKKLLQGQCENNEGLNYRGSNGIGEIE